MKALLRFIWSNSNPSIHTHTLLQAARELDAKSNAKFREECERLVDESTRRNASEIRDMKEQLAIEKTNWEEMYHRKQQGSLRAKVNMLC